MPLGTEVNIGPGDDVLDGVAASLKGVHWHSPPVFSPCLLWPNGRPSQLLLSSCVNSCHSCKSEANYVLLFSLALMRLDQDGNAYFS